MPELAYVNGSFCDLGEAKVSVEDRGFQFGDGVYEVIVSYGGRLFLLEDHLARLQRSCDAIELPFDVHTASIADIIEEGLTRSGLNEAMIYVQVTRGVAPRSHAIPEAIEPTVVMTFKPRPSLPDDLRRRGARVLTVPETRWANCYIKAITLLPNTLARHQAVRRGYDDAVFVTADGEVRECTSANVFMVQRGVLVIPPLTEAILHGVTQKFLLTCAEGIGLTKRHEVLHIDAFREADEAFMSSTVGEVLGITAIDDRNVGTGRVGPVTQRLYDEFRRRTREV